MIDIVKDQLYGGDYIKEEDPKLFISEKTKRGPLQEEWLEEYWKEVFQNTVSICIWVKGKVRVFFPVDG